MIKCAKLYIRGIPVGEEREAGIENVFEEIMAENLPNLKKKSDTGTECIEDSKPLHTKTYCN